MESDNFRKKFFFVKHGVLIIFITVILVFVSLELLQVEGVTILRRIVDYFINKPV